MPPSLKQSMIQSHPPVYFPPHPMHQILQNCFPAHLELRHGETVPYFYHRWEGAIKNSGRNRGRRRNIRESRRDYGNPPEKALFSRDLDRPNLWRKNVSGAKKYFDLERLEQGSGVRNTYMLHMFMKASGAYIACGLQRCKTIGPYWSNLSGKNLQKKRGSI